MKSTKTYFIPQQLSVVLLTPVLAYAEIVLAQKYGWLYPACTSTGLDCIGPGLRGYIYNIDYVGFPIVLVGLLTVVIRGIRHRSDARWYLPISIGLALTIPVAFYLLIQYMRF